MKTIRIILLVVVWFISKFNYGQCNLFSINQFDPKLGIIEMGIDSSFYSSGLVCSITDGPVSGLSVTADIKLYSYEGYIRILLSDLEHNQDYLVYEAYYPLNSLDTLYHIEDYAYESSMLYNLSKVIVRVEIHNGECYFSGVSYYNTPYVLDKDRFEKEKRQLKRVQDSVFLSSLNQRIKEEDFLWIAGPTSISELFYDQRKDMLPKNTANEIPNLQGLEYYKGGVFEVLTDSVQNRTTYTSNYIDDFDWRNRHGQNWLTTAKTQQCNHCWVFCPVSVAESSVNLYFNQRINYDLSEQHVASCNGHNQGNCLGGQITYSLSFLVNQGVVLETCFPYQNGDFQTVPCSFCDNPSETISFNNYSTVPNVVDSIKKAVIVNGPICGGIESLWHYMPIVGFKTLKVGDTLFYNQGFNNYEIIQPNDHRIGQTCWLFKNSKGVGWGHKGCAYFLPQLNDLYGLYKLVTPESQIYDDSDIVCEDIDGDGYYNWGIGPKPATCHNCPDEPDCDDSDPLLGPYGADYACISFCDPPVDTTTIRINGVVTWNTDKYIYHNIVVSSGSVLTITSTIRLGHESKIIIQPGAKLIVDGGLLTSPCEGMWPGIEVWGDSNTHQFIINGVCGQGQLELKHGATIENAVCAIELHHPGVSGTTGGVVYADNAMFINNAKSVHIPSYVNYNPYTDTESNYRSGFVNTSFVIDENYSGVKTFCEHVELDHVKGISFQGCVFSVSEDALGVSSSSCGINAYDASFVVKDYCDSDNNFNFNVCPDEYMIRSSFSGFYEGVRSVNDGMSVRTFGVKNALFTNNNRGIFARNTGYATILNNHFVVGKNADCSFGVYIDGVTGFCIEENTFTSNDEGSENYGIGVFNSTGGNDIYHNYIEGMDCGNLAKGMNGTGVGGSITVGLTYSCNQNDNNSIDFCVLKDGGVGGIYPDQGSSSLPAGNTFDGSTYHFFNDGSFPINYYYYSGNPDQTPSNVLLYGVNRTSVNIENKCRTHYGAVSKSQNEKALLEELFNSANNWHDRYLAAGDIVRSNLIDTISNTEELRTWLGNMGDITADRTVVASFVQEGDFSNAFSVAEKLPDLYELEGRELEDHSGFMMILGLFRDLYDTHRTTEQLYENEKAMLRTLAETGVGFSKSLAIAIIEHVSDGLSMTNSCPVLPAGCKSVNETANQANQEVSGFTVNLTPNPSSSWVRIDYVLSKESASASLSIFNILGVEVMNVMLEGEKGSKIIMFENIQQGVYSYKVRSGNDVIEGKLIIVH